MVRKTSWNSKKYDWNRKIDF